MSESLRKSIETIPGEDGWWNYRAFEKFLAIGRKLMSMGIPEEEVLDALYELYWAVSDR